MGRGAEGLEEHGERDPLTSPDHGDLCGADGVLVAQQVGELVAARIQKVLIGDLHRVAVERDLGANRVRQAGSEVPRSAIKARVSSRRSGKLALSSVDARSEYARESLTRSEYPREGLRPKGQAAAESASARAAAASSTAYSASSIA